MPKRSRRLTGGLTRRQLLMAGMAVGAASFTSTDALIATSRVFASVSQPQTPLPSANIPKYVTALRTFGVDQRVESSAFTTKMVEFQQVVLPPSLYPSAFSSGTWLWGYQVDGKPPSWPGFSVEAQRGTPTNITYVNNLPVGASRSHLEPLLTVDQTIHWADPLNAGNS